ncbi:hypothetical protein MMAGJ_27250 [Mycolicibacterium mageritense]|uniref:Uncharacterized protein n=1 Tax=Mycolicibacterium mageritense TaxID=53462 RepID=A0ABN5Y725_MYCME|nr:hypothetical protein MMAGJ_27250 [Mycolicibacterium mageritense]GJJ21593.1 hypothetical protein MTY414_52660 [Mycolicibacterium mageritense]
MAAAATAVAWVKMREVFREMVIGLNLPMVRRRRSGAEVTVADHAPVARVNRLPQSHVRCDRPGLLAPYRDLSRPGARTRSDRQERH